MSPLPSRPAQINPPVNLLHSVYKGGVAIQVKTSTVVHIRVLTPIIKATIEAQGHRDVLKEHGGEFTCSHTWVYRVLKRLKLSYRKATTAAQKLPPNWQELTKLLALRCEQVPLHIISAHNRNFAAVQKCNTREASVYWMCRLAFLVRRHDIPPALVVNFDQTGIHLVPTAGGRTYAPTGKKEICLIGQDDKRQMTGTSTPKICTVVQMIQLPSLRLCMSFPSYSKTVACAGVPLSSADGRMGPFQLIVQGTTVRTLKPMEKLMAEPRFEDWLFSFSDNHWSNLDTMKEFVSKLLVPWCASLVCLTTGFNFPQLRCFGADKTVEPDALMQVETQDQRHGASRGPKGCGSYGLLVCAQIRGISHMVEKGVPVAALSVHPCR